MNKYHDKHREADEREMARVRRKHEADRGYEAELMAKGKAIPRGKKPTLEDIYIRTGFGPRAGRGVSASVGPRFRKNIPLPPVKGSK